ncbi:hypothetical protein BTVI_07932 [Pitangus sulphuratus]|nr:hypothetical protein BTVI_07932 [Pitangus sulphuratus]
MGDIMADKGTQTITTAVIAPVVKRKKRIRQATGPHTDQYGKKMMKKEKEKKRKKIEEKMEKKEKEQTDQKPGPSTKKLKGVRQIKQETKVIQSLTSSELWDLQKDYICQPAYSSTGVQGGISKTRSPFNSPIRPVQKSNGEWRLTVDYRDLNEVMTPLSATVPDVLELQDELESKAAKWCHY